MVLFHMDRKIDKAKVVQVMLKKEIMTYFLDHRFILVLGFCILLSFLSVYVSTRNYSKSQKEYLIINRIQQERIQDSIAEEDGTFVRNFYRWTSPPEVLNIIVYGLSGTRGREALIQPKSVPKLKNSLFANDPLYPFFEILDLVFVVKFVLSICIFLFTHDVICGEKENGTLRIYVSYPISRVTLALVKITSASVAIVVPLSLSFLISCAWLSLASSIQLHFDDWIRIFFLLVLFSIYLIVFATFGVWVSSMTHRCINSFLLLLALWIFWVFMIPNISVYVGNFFSEVTSSHSIEHETRFYKETLTSEKRKEFDKLTETRRTSYPSRKVWQEKMEERIKKMEAISDAIDEKFYRYTDRMRELQANQANKKRQVIELISALSPMGPLTFISMDLARTGPYQQDDLESALNVYFKYLDKHGIDSLFPGSNSEFVPFHYEDQTTIQTSFSRHLFQIMILCLWGLVGFSGAFVAIIKYDVR